MNNLISQHDDKAAEMILIFFMSATLLCSSSDALAEAGDDVLLEYSCDYFSEESHGQFPDIELLHPPSYKAYKDGKVVFQENGRFYSGSVSARTFTKVKRLLDDPALPKRSSYLPNIKGESLLMHGGVCYLSYSTNHESTLLVASVKPMSGKWSRIMRITKKSPPLDPELFLPNRIIIGIRKIAFREFPEWKYSNILRLAEAASLPETILSDTDVISLFFSHHPFSPLRHFNEGGVSYSVTILEVPGWYEPAEKLNQITSIVRSGQ